MAGKFEMKLTQKLTGEYKKGTKKEKGEILDRYCKLTKVKRNTAAKRFRQEPLSKGTKDLHRRKTWAKEKIYDYPPKNNPPLLEIVGANMR